MRMLLYKVNSQKILTTSNGNLIEGDVLILENNFLIKHSPLRSFISSFERLLVAAVTRFGLVDVDLNEIILKCSLEQTI